MKTDTAASQLLLMYDYVMMTAACNGDVAIFCHIFVLFLSYACLILPIGADRGS